MARVVRSAAKVASSGRKDIKIKARSSVPGGGRAVTLDGVCSSVTRNLCALGAHVRVSLGGNVRCDERRRMRGEDRDRKSCPNRKLL